MKLRQRPWTHLCKIQTIANLHCLFLALPKPHHNPLDPRQICPAWYSRTQDAVLPSQWALLVTQTRPPGMLVRLDPVESERLERRPRHLAPGHLHHREIETIPMPAPNAQRNRGIWIRSKPDTFTVAAMGVIQQRHPHINYHAPGEPTLTKRRARERAYLEKRRKLTLTWRTANHK
jgi:hypothetical protein